MASRYSGEGSEREGGNVSSSGCSQYICLSEDRVKSGSGGTQSEETANDSVFSDSVKEHLVKKNFRDVLERVPESGMVTLAENLVYGASGDLPETNQRDKSHQRICPTFAHLRLQAGERVMVEKEIL